MIDIIHANWDIEFMVPGNPKALKRHRTVKKGKFIGTYDPSVNDKADFLAMAIQHKPPIPYNEALFVEFNFLFSRPKNHYRTGSKAHLLKDSAPHYHTGTPDADNLAKFVCDAFNGVFWRDDSCISEMFITKTYHTTPGIIVKIKTLYTEPQGDIFN